MKTRITCSIKRGEVEVNEGCYVIDRGPDVQEWVFDLATKYAWLAAHSMTTVILMADENTLKPDKSRLGQTTEIGFTMPRSWNIELLSCNRYTCRVLLAKRNDRYRMREWTETKEHQ